MKRRFGLLKDASWMRDITPSQDRVRHRFLSDFGLAPGARCPPSSFKQRRPLPAPASRASPRSRPVAPGSLILAIMSGYLASVVKVCVDISSLMTSSAPARPRRTTSGSSRESKAIPTGGKVQKSVYLVKSEATSPKAVADDLWKYMDGNDRIFVVEVANNYSWANVLCQESWLEQFFAT